VSWANAEGGVTWNLADSITSTTPIAIPTAPGTNFSWIKNLVEAVTVAGTTNITNRTIKRSTQDEKQTVTITGSPTGGTFTLTFGAQTTSTIAFNASAATVQTALQALSSIGASNATVTGSAGGPWTVDFSGSLADTAQSLMTANGSGLTGGTSPGVSIARTQSGWQSSGMALWWKAVAVASYAQAASGNRPASSGSNGATPSGYTAMTTTAAQYDNTSVATSGTGPNGSMAVCVLGVDNSYVGGAGSAVSVPSVVLSYDEA
jgi:hypothetical protein